MVDPADFRELERIVTRLEVNQRDHEVRLDAVENSLTRWVPVVDRLELADEVAKGVAERIGRDRQARWDRLHPLAKVLVATAGALSGLAVVGNSLRALGHALGAW